MANKIPVSDPLRPTWFPSDGPVGLYIHVPFCAHACDFCAFYQVEPRREDIVRYLETIEKEMALFDAGRRFATAFWGGGTPGLLSTRDLARLGEMQVARFGTPVQEWTVELAPGSVKPDKLRVLRDLGVTRVSLGIQSLNERTLDELGRRHSRAQIHQAWAAVQAAGFASTNLDLIFAAPGQSIADWRADLVAAAGLGPDHISTYCLTFEEDTALYVRLSAGQVSIDAEREREFYESTWDVLGGLGFFQYEISNHARPGHACRHNINTWRMHQWVGIGPSAASQYGRVRGSNAHDLDAWRNAVAAGRHAPEERVILTTPQLVEDALIFGLRMNEGVSLVEIATRFGEAAVASFRPLVEDMVREGLACWANTAGDTVALTRRGRLVADAVGAELVGSGGDAGEPRRFHAGPDEH